VSEFVAATRAYAAGAIDAQAMRHEADIALACADGLRDDECDALGVPRGSSVAHGAQTLLEALDRNSAAGSSQALEMAEAKVDAALAELGVRKDKREERKEALLHIPHGMLSN
jgi:hypothetical protein